MSDRTLLRAPLPDSPYIRAIDAVYWLTFGCFPSSDDITELELAGDQANWRERTTVCATREANLEQFRRTERTFFAAHADHKVSLIGRRHPKGRPELIPPEYFACNTSSRTAVALELRTNSICPNGVVEFAEFEANQGLDRWDDVAVARHELIGFATPPSDEVAANKQPPEWPGLPGIPSRRDDWCDAIEMFAGDFWGEHHRQPTVPEIWNGLPKYRATFQIALITRHSEEALSMSGVDKALTKSGLEKRWPRYVGNTATASNDRH